MHPSNPSYCGSLLSCLVLDLTDSMSHYDVVPAPESTFDRWTYPPFSGHNDGKDIWGRGAADDKTLLVAQCKLLRAWSYEPVLSY
jgi:acetylornithine deacetylase/succinyl-diaminopimelate desuccinylase-like protein